MASIEQRLNDAMKQAMRDKQAELVNCIRQVKAKVQEATNAEGFKGAVDDALHQTIIANYTRSLEKSFVDLEKAGERGQTLIDKYKAEITYLKQYLPQMLGEAETRDIVKQTLVDLNTRDPKQMGKITGAIMKDHKGRVDPALVRRILEEELG